MSFILILILVVTVSLSPLSCPIPYSPPLFLLLLYSLLSCFFSSILSSPFLSSSFFYFDSICILLWSILPYLFLPLPPNLVFHIPFAQYCRKIVRFHSILSNDAATFIRNTVNSFKYQLATTQHNSSVHIKMLQVTWFAVLRDQSVYCS